MRHHHKPGCHTGRMAARGEGLFGADAPAGFEYAPGLITSVEETQLVDAIAGVTVSAFEGDERWDEHAAADAGPCEVRCLSDFTRLLA